MSREQELYLEIKKYPWIEGDYRPAIYRQIPKELYDEYLPYAERASKMVNKESLHTRTLYRSNKPIKELYWFGTGLGLLEPI